MSRNSFGAKILQKQCIFLALSIRQRRRKSYLNAPIQVNMDHLLAHGTFRIGEMAIKKTIYRDTLRTLEQYSDQPILISQNRHIKFSGSLKGAPWVFTLQTSPSRNYLERSLRSQIRRFQRQYNWISRRSGTISKPYSAALSGMPLSVNRRQHPAKGVLRCNALEKLLGH